MEFYKLNGAGNDFIILNNMDGSIDPSDYPTLAKVLCERHLSIGADGLMAVEPSERADYRMIFYNTDGSQGEMCGNGARCICRFGYELGLAGQTQTVESPSGIVTGQRLDERSYRVRLTDVTCLEPSRPVTLDGTTYDCAYIELGTPGLPHAVVNLPGLAAWDTDELRRIGRTLRYAPAFPKGANVNFYDLTEPDAALLRTFERGVEDFTYACGTGSASTALTIALRAGKKDASIRLNNRGGMLTVDICHENGDDAYPALYLTGPTNIVAIGLAADEELPARYQAL